MNFSTHTHTHYMCVPWLRHKCLVFSCRTEGIKWQNRSRKCFNNFITKLDFVSIPSVSHLWATADEYSAATHLSPAISYFAFHRRWHSSKGRNVCKTRAICPFMYVWCIISRRAAFHVGRRADLSLWHSKRLFSLSFFFRIQPLLLWAQHWWQYSRERHLSFRLLLDTVGLGW